MIPMSHVPMLRHVYSIAILSPAPSERSDPTSVRPVSPPSPCRRHALRAHPRAQPTAPATHKPVPPGTPSLLPFVWAELRRAPACLPHSPTAHPHSAPTTPRLPRPARAVSLTSILWCINPR
eukprot:COSAG04_NODE_3401_length_2850_cov_1.384587_5_plen_121_part_01